MTFFVLLLASGWWGFVPRIINQILNTKMEMPFMSWTGHPLSFVGLFLFLFCIPYCFLQIFRSTGRVKRETNDSTNLFVHVFSPKHTYITRMFHYGIFYWSPGGAPNFMCKLMNI